MARLIFTYVLPFLLPTAIYVTWAWFRAGYVARHGGQAPRIEQGPWPVLMFLGAVCAFGALAATALMRGGPAGERYIPAHIEAGKIIPGHLEAKKP